jgi:uncharacterized protein involved in exopolysaccharide biosynthesis
VHWHSGCSFCLQLRRTTVKGTALQRKTNGLLIPVYLDSDEPGINLGIMLAEFLKHWRQILAVAIVFGSTALIATMLVHPIYRASTTIMPVQDSSNASLLGNLGGQLGGLAALAGVSLDSSSTSKSEALAVLQSRDLISRFIAENDLLPVLFQKDWSSDESKWLATGADVPSDEDGYIRFVDAVLEVAEDRSTGIVEVSVEWSSPKLAADWANKLVALANSRMKERAILESEQSIKFLEDILSRTDLVDIRQSLFRVLESQMQQAMLANIRQQYAFTVIDPATPPDSDRYVWPRKLLILLAGLLVGTAAGILLVFIGIIRRGNADPPGVSGVSE